MKKSIKIVKGLLMIGMGVAMIYVQMYPQIGDMFTDTSYYNDLFVFALIAIGILEIGEAIYGER